MSRSILLLAAVATMALGACSESKVETAKSHGVSIDTDTGTTASATHITIDGDTDSDKLAVRLPGGIEAKVNLPGGMVNVGRFDIDGVGLYPGAKVHSVDVNAADAARTDSAVLKIGFAAPADAAAVADWYQQQFAARHRAVTRSGETLSGTNADDDTFTLALTQAGTGRTQGLLTIISARD